MTQFKVDFNDFKRRDNTNLMEITLYKDSGEQITPNRDHQWSGKALKFGDGDKRLEQELAVTIDGDKIGVPSKQLENLPSGDYGLELWEVNNDSKTIYPSAGFVEFHIHRNADESLESVTPTIDIDKVIDDLHQAGLNVVVDDIEMLAPDAKPSVTSEVRDGKNHIKLHVPRGFKGDIGPAPALKIGTVTKLNPDQTPTANISGDNGAYTLDLGIPQGSKGATGTVDNTGLISAPAFQSLQTQVNNSAVGTNLLTGTGSHTVTGTGAFTMGYLSNETTDDFITLFKELEGQTVTVSVDYKYSGFVAGSGNNNLGWETLITSDSKLWGGTWYSPTNDSGSGRISATFVVPKNITSVVESRGYIQFSGSGTGTLSHLKLEKGTVATPWCPNPAEILTQSDYAKIKAAIVALGGSLS